MPLTSSRDCTWCNIVADPRPLFPQMFHPVRYNCRRDNVERYATYYSRTARPTKYYFIDFGISRKYKPEDVPFLEDPILGGDKSAPEFQVSDDPQDPFPTDVYYIGNLVRQHLMKVCLLQHSCIAISDDIVEEHHNLEFLAPLVADMVQNDPSKRPTMTEVVDRFSEIRSNLSWIELRSRLVRKDEVGAMKVFNDIYHLLWTVCQIILLRSAIPNTY